MLLLLHQIFFGRRYLGEAVLHCFGELRFSNIFVKDGLHFYLADILIVSFFLFTLGLEYILEHLYIFPMKKGLGNV